MTSRSVKHRARELQQAEGIPYAEARTRIIEDDQEPQRFCDRCGTGIVGQAVAVFEPVSVTVQRPTNLAMCVECGKNGGNTTSNLSYDDGGGITR